MDVTGYDHILAACIANGTTDISGIHGLAHWRQVEENGRLLAERTGGVAEDVVRLFAVLHDSQRLHDGEDPGHGPRAAQYASSLRGQGLLDLPDNEFELLDFACRWHTSGQLSSNPSIATCFDADRLDLSRVGVQPKAEYMSTAAGKELAGGSRQGGKTQLFTVDTKSTFRTGMVIEPAPDTLIGQGGLMVMTQALWNIQRGYSSDEQIHIETALELVRRERFPQYPSRQYVFFACANLAELERLNDQCNRKRGFHGDIYEIEGKSHGPFDTLAAFTRWSDDLMQRSRCYWRQLETPRPLFEYLVTLPVRIGRQVGTI